jgi:hypothetical protein
VITPTPSPGGLDRIFSNPLAMYAIGLLAGSYMGWHFGRASARCRCAEATPEQVAALVALARTELERQIIAEEAPPDA